MQKRLAREAQGKALHMSGGYVVEVFSGIQGEGTHVGERHLFLRLAGCGYGCEYCDQPEARNAPRQALIEKTAGRRDFDKMPNPLLVAALQSALLRLWKAAPHRALAVTGGEPLTQADFLSPLLPKLRSKRIPIFLETNGVMAAEMKKLRGLVDIISMDLKLQSATGKPFPRARHQAFLKNAIHSGAELYAKAVVTRRTTTGEIRAAAKILSRFSKQIPLVLQPITHRRGSGFPPTPERVMEILDAAAGILDDVRVIPQTHKMIGQR